MTEEQRDSSEDPTLPLRLRPPKDLPSSPRDTYRANLEDLLSPAELPDAEGSEDASSGSHIPTMAGLRREDQDLPDSIRSPADKERGPSTGFEFLRRVGQGTMGEVWETIQRGLWRKVAVKRLRDDGDQSQIGTASHRVRIFQGEAMIAAQLDHPNILPVYDFGYDQAGNPLLSMKMVRGKSWSEILRRDFTTLTPDEYIEKHLPILVQVAQAVAFAHSRGIMHRDLKPAQVMVGEYGEVLLTDWGLAVMFEISPPIESKELPYHLYPSRDFALCPAGTPSYMAPEQTDDLPNRLGPWTDCYLLGGILFFLLTGVPPHPGDSSNQAFIMASSGEVPALEEAAPGRHCPRALRELAMQALSPKPQDRPTAREFLSALQDFVTGAKHRRESQEITREVARDSVGTSYREIADALARLGQARVLWPANPDYDPLREKLIEHYARMALKRGDLRLARAESERLGHKGKRAELLLLVEAAERGMRTRESLLRVFGATILILLLLLFIGGGWFTLRLMASIRVEKEHAKAATDARIAIQQARQTAERESRRAKHLLADSLTSQGRREEAIAELLRIPESQRFWEWSLLLTRAINDLWMIPFEYLQWSPSRDLAIGVNGEDGLCILRAESGQVLFRIAESLPEDLIVAFSQDEARVALSGEAFPPRVIDTSVWSEIARFEPGRGTAITALEFSPDGRRLALGDRSGVVSIVDIQNRETFSLALHRRSIRALYWGGDRLISISSDAIRRSNTEDRTSELIHQTDAIESIWHDLYFTADRQRRFFAVAHQNASPVYGKVQEGELDQCEGSAVSLAITNRNPWLILSSGMNFPQYRIIDLETGEDPVQPDNYSTHGPPRPAGFSGLEFGGVQFSETEDRVLVHGDGVMRLMEFPEVGDLPWAQRIPVESTRRIVLMPNGRAVWIVDESGSTHIQSLDTPYVGTHIPGGVASFARSDRYVSSLSLRWFEQRDVETGGIVFVGGRDYHLYLGSRVTSDDEMIFLPGYRGQRFTVEKSQRSDSAILGIYTFDFDVGAFALHADTSRLALTDTSRSGILLYSLATEEAQLEATIELPEQSVLLELSHAAQGRLLIAGLQDGRLLVFDAETGQRQIELQAHQGELLAVRLIAEHELLATFGSDRTIRLWKEETLERTAELEYDFDIDGLKLSLDGEKILAWPERGAPVLRQVSTGLKLAELDRLGFPMEDVRFLDDDWRIVASSNGAARFWSTRTGRETFSLEKGFGTISNSGRHFIFMSSDYSGTLMEIAPNRAPHLGAGQDVPFRDRLEEWMLERYESWCLREVRSRIPEELELLAQLDRTVDGDSPLDLLQLLHTLIVQPPRYPGPIRRLVFETHARLWLSQPASFSSIEEPFSSSLFRRAFREFPELAQGVVGTAAIASAAKECEIFDAREHIDDPSQVEPVTLALESAARVYELRGDPQRAIALARRGWAIRDFCGFQPDSGAGILQRLGAEPPAPSPPELRLGVSAAMAPMMISLLAEMPPADEREDLERQRIEAWRAYQAARDGHLDETPAPDWQALLAMEKASPNWETLPAGMTASELARDLKDKVERILYGEQKLEGALREERRRLDSLFAWKLGTEQQVSSGSVASQAREQAFREPLEGPE